VTRFAFAALVWTATAGLGAALHLSLVDSAPKKDETVTAAPQTVQLRFSERVEPRLTTVTLVGADSAAVPLGRVAQAGDNPAAISVPVTGTLRPGTWEVRWRTTARDGHVVRGSYRFTFRPAN
jgi:methionine-rich copper-binding protein CopC